MDKKTDWKKFIEENNLVYDSNQESFYKRIKDFLRNKKEFLINQGGMGLGKTKATVYAMNNCSNFVATPFSQIKNEWSEELNKCKKSHAVWISKGDCCIKKRGDIKFKLENCNDGCKYRSHLEANREYCLNCDIISKTLKFPLNVNTYYETNGIKDCLYPLTRNRIESEKIIVGDYFGLLIPKMFRMVTKKNQYETELHIDEAHMIIERTKQFLSRQFSIGRMIKMMKRALDEEDYFLINFDKKVIFQKYMEAFELTKQELINLIRGKSEKILRITYYGFMEVWNKKTHLNFNNFKNEIKLFIEKTNSSDLENPAIFEQTLNFFEYWEEKTFDEDYKGLFQYFSYNEEEIMLKVNCSDTGKFLKNVLSIWKKVHLLSGTIPDKEYYIKMLGIESCDYSFEEPLDSYSIKDRVINYGVGNFTSSMRKETYKNNLQLLKKVLKKLDGRTLIYVQSKSNVIDLKELLNEFKPFCFDVNSNYELSLIKERFNQSKKGLAIGYITGKVEGQNFLDDDGNAVENIIIYGYPYMQRGLEYNDYLEHWIKKLDGDIKKAKEYVEFFPISSRIYQASMRAKRSNKDNPTIILWSKEFSQGNPGYKYSYQELKGEVIHEPDKLIIKIDELKKRERDGTNK